MFLKKPRSLDSKIQDQARSAIDKFSYWWRQQKNKLGFGDLESLEGQSRSFRIWMFSSFGALICILLLNLKMAEPNGDQTLKPSSAFDLAGHIPYGFVLVPIEPVNLEAIDAVLGDKGWADLYVDRTGQGAEFSNNARTSRKRIAVGVPLIRAPRNPNQLAVLVNESNSTLIGELGQPVHVALRKSPPTKVASSTKDTTSRVKARKMQLEFVHELEIEDAK